MHQLHHHAIVGGYCRALCAKAPGKSQVHHHGARVGTKGQDEEYHSHLLQKLSNGLLNKTLKELKDCPYRIPTEAK